MYAGDLDKLNEMYEDQIDRHKRDWLAQTAAKVYDDDNWMKHRPAGGMHIIRWRTVSRVLGFWKF